MRLNAAHPVRFRTSAAERAQTVQRLSESLCLRCHCTTELHDRLKHRFVLLFEGLDLTSSRCDNRLQLLELLFLRSYYSKSYLWTTYPLLFNLLKHLLMLLDHLSQILSRYFRTYIYGSMHVRTNPDLRKRQPTYSPLPINPFKIPGRNLFKLRRLLKLSPDMTL